MSNSNNEHLRQLLEAVASGLYTHQSGVRVAWAGDKKSAYTDGKTVFLPTPTKEMTSGDWRVLQGYIDHEVGHVQYSDSTTPAIVEAPKSLRKVTNIFEDARVNRTVTAKWVGSRVNLGALYDRCSHELDGDEASKTASTSSPVAHRLNALNFKLSGFAPKTWAFSDADNAWAQKWADEFHRSFSAGSSTTLDMQAIASRCLIDLKQDLETPPPPPPPPDGEGKAGDKDDTCKGDDSEDAKGKGKGKGKGEGDGEGEGEGTATPDEAEPEEGEAGQGEAGQGEAGQGEAQHSHGPSQHSPNSGGVGASDSGCNTDVDLDAGMDAVTDGVEQALSGATGTEVKAQEDGAMPDCHTDRQLVSVGELEIDCHTGSIRQPKGGVGSHGEHYAKGVWNSCATHSDAAQKDMESSRAKAGSLASHLERVLKAKAVGYTLNRQEDGERLDRSSFSSIATNTHGGRVWEQDIRGDVKSACVGIYIDGSSSMTDRFNVGGGSRRDVCKCSAAGFATQILVEALERCGVATEVGIWDSGCFDFTGGYGCGPTPNSYAVGIRTVVAKRFDRPFRGAEVARVKQPFADGGTPLALSAAILPSRLASRKEARKIAIILTDGNVGGNEAKAFDVNCKLAQRAGVEVILVGIGTSLGLVKHKHKVFALTASELPTALATCLPNILTATRSEARK